MAVAATQVGSPDRAVILAVADAVALRARAAPIGRSEPRRLVRYTFAALSLSVAETASEEYLSGQEAEYGTVSPVVVYRPTGKLCYRPVLLFSQTCPRP